MRRFTVKLNDHINSKPKSDDWFDWRGVEVQISYNKLWKLLIDKGMKRKDLQEAAGISSALASIVKLGKGKNITTDVLLRICKALDCEIVNILDTVSDKMTSV